jgi:serine/threonine protein kinase
VIDHASLPALPSLPSLPALHALAVRHEHIVLFFGAGYFPLTESDSIGEHRTRHRDSSLPKKLPFLVTEYLHNGSLGSVLHSDLPLPWALRIKICLHAAIGIGFLHNVVHVVHRDIKSMNLLVSEDWVSGQYTDNILRTNGQYTPYKYSLQQNSPPPTPSHTPLTSP